MAVIPQGTFIFDGSNPQSIARQRALAALILRGMGRGNSAPRNVGEGIGQGLAAIGDGIVARVLNKRADAAEKAGMAGAADLTDEFGNYLANRNTFPAAPGSAYEGSSDASASSEAGDVENYIRQAAQQRGIDPDIAVRVAQGEGGLQNPFRHGEGPAPKSQLASFGPKENSFGPLQLYISGTGAGLGDRALAAGIDPRKDWKGGVNFALDEAAKRGWGQWYGAKAQGITGMMGIGRRPAADAVNAFAGGQPIQPAPQQVASLDPSVGMVTPRDPSTSNPVAAGQPIATDAKTQRIMDQMMSPQPMGGAPMPMQGMSQPAPQQTAQAQPGGPDLSRIPVTAGGNAGVLPSGQTPPMDYRMLMRVLSNPFVPDSMKAFANAQLEQTMKSQDPAYQLDMDYKRAQIDALRNPGGKPTDDMREYQFARQQGYQGTFQQYMLDMKRASATNVNVGAGEKAWDQESAKLFAKRYDDITGAAGNAQNMLGMYDLAEQAMTSGVRTGFGAETELNLRQLGASMGIDTDPKKLAGGELIRSIQNRMALLMRSPDGGMGMPGALSDRDIKFLKDAQIGLDRSPQGNQKMLAAFRAMENRKIELSQLADQYVQDHGRLDAGFNKAVREYAEAHPLFSDTPTGGNADNIPQAAIDMLRSNPSLADQFDAKYGQGAASRALGGR